MENQENLVEVILSNPQKIDELVKLGLIPLAELPWLKRAIIHMQGGMFLPTPERQIFYRFLEKFLDLTLNDPVLFRLLRQRIIMSKYNTQEETEFVDEGRKRVISLSGPDVKKAPEGMLDTFANIVKNKLRAGGKVTPADMSLASRARNELRRRRRHMGEEKDQGEYDFEGAMAKTQLRSILHNAQQLHDMLKDNENLPEWVQSKITLAEDYIVTAANYMQAEKNVKESFKVGDGVVPIKEDVEFDISFAEKLQLALDHFNLTSVKDLTIETQKEFFNYLENINTATGE